MDQVSFIKRLWHNLTEHHAHVIFRRYRRGMYWTAYEILKNEADAEDAVMMAMEKILQNPGLFQGKTEDEEKRLILRIIKNTAIDLLRVRILRGRYFVSDGQVRVEGARDKASTEDAALRSLYGETDFGTLQKYVSRLDEKYIQVLTLKYGERLTNREISRRLQIPESTVATRLARAHARLRKMIEEDTKNGDNDKSDENETREEG